MGATRWETVRRVLLPAALSGIAAAVILAMSRAVGETMIVLMVLVGLLCAEWGYRRVVGLA